MMSQKMKLLLIFLSLLTLPMTAQYRANEWEARDHWQQVDQIMDHLDLSPAMHVADIGCHEGYLTMKLSPMVGNSGQVYAVDIEKHKLAKLSKRLKAQSISNVQTIHGTADNPRLPEARLDRVVILDTYHEIEHFEKVLAHLHQALKPGGKMIIIEPIATSRESWTRDEQADKHEISLRYVLEDLDQAGFQVNKTINPFIDRPSKYDQMWLLVATKPENN